MASEIVCPFCGARSPLVDAAGRLLFHTDGSVAHYRCPCGAVAFHSPWIRKGVPWGEREAVETVRGHLGVGPMVGLVMSWGWITETDPPEPLLWVQASSKST